MDMQEIDAPGWQKIVRFRDPAAGLDALIAVHDATLGPGCGGCRVRPYGSVEEALQDVKNLSRGMTYKNALGGIPFGGGKAVIIADPRTDKTEAMFRAFGRAIESLGGLYYTAEDSGVSETDLAFARQETEYVAGIAAEGEGGNPSPFTSRGVWRGIQAAARRKLGASSLDGVSVAILGVGAVGMGLAELLHKEGARLVVSDVNEEAVTEAVRRFGAMSISPDECAGADVDVFSPCALGGAINDRTIGQLRAKIVAGAANNQLATPEMDQALVDRDILYAPDYVINAAGVISVGLEILHRWSEPEMTRRIDRIGDTLSEIFERAAQDGEPTGMVADRMAKEVIAKGRKAA